MILNSGNRDSVRSSQSLDKLQALKIVMHCNLSIQDLYVLEESKGRAGVFSFINS